MIPINTTLGSALQTLDHWVILTGAGCSTKAGLGDYRNKQGEWKRPQPITGQVFRSDELARKRYWARSFVGWPHFAAAKPTDSHSALATLQSQLNAPTLITQNVDQLHQKAKHQNVIDLHGVLSEVICLDCNQVSSRESQQERLLSNNPWLSELDAAYAPDGDADLDDQRTHNVKVPNCLMCNGLLKPNVVFFGENVPRERVQACFEALDAANGLLIVGSSLMVYSGFRFCRRAQEKNKPIIIVNSGLTRADELAWIKYDEECGAALNNANTEISGQRDWVFG